LIHTRSGPAGTKPWRRAVTNASPAS